MPDYSSDSAYWDSVAHFKDENNPDIRCIHHNAQKCRVLVPEILKHNMHKKMVLEIGAGSGVVASVISRVYMNEIKYLGTDISENFLATAQKLMGLKVTKARSTELPVGDGKADFVFMFDVFEHIHPDERVKTAQEIGRVLKKGGILIMNSPMLESKHAQYDYGIGAADGKTIEEHGGLKNTKIKVISYTCKHDPFRMYLYEEFTKI